MSVKGSCALLVSCCLLQSACAKVVIESSPLAEYSRNAQVMAFAASAVPESCTKPEFGTKVDDSCCEGTPIQASITPVETAYTTPQGKITCMAQNPGFVDNSGIAVYFNCPAEGGELDVAAVCAMKQANDTYDSGAGGKWGANYPMVGVGPPGTAFGKLITAEECGCVWKYQTQGAGCYRQMDLTMYPNIPSMAGLRWFMKFTSCGSSMGKTAPSYTPEVKIAESPLAQHSRNAQVMAFAASAVPESCTKPEFGAKVDDSCCEGTPIQASITPVETAYTTPQGKITCMAQNPGFTDNSGIAVYFNCPANGGELDVAAVCAMKQANDTYDSGAGGKWGANYPMVGVGPPGTAFGKLITAEECGCVWKYQTKGAGCYRQMDLTMYPNIPSMAGLRWFLKFTGCGEAAGSGSKSIESMKTCVDLKKHYKNSGCCGNPTKMLDMDGRSKEEEAFVRWASTLAPLAKTSGGIPECVRLYKSMNVYPPTASMPDPPNNIIKNGTAVSMAVCTVFNMVTHKESSMGAGAVVNVTHCNGVWRGAFPAFANASAFGAQTGALLATVPRGFSINGTLDSMGRFVPDTDFTFPLAGAWSYDKMSTHKWTCAKVGP